MRTVDGLAVRAGEVDAGNSSCGRAEVAAASVRDALERGRAPPACRRGTPTPVSRLTCASSQAARVETPAGHAHAAGRASRELDLDRELGRRPRSRARRSCPPRRRRLARGVERREPLGGVAHDDPGDVGVAARPSGLDFALRTAASTSAATVVHERRRRRADAARAAASGHAARWIEPSRHHDHTSSVTNGRSGANSAQQRRQRERAA